MQQKAFERFKDDNSTGFEMTSTFELLRKHYRAESRRLYNKKKPKRSNKLRGEGNKTGSSSKSDKKMPVFR